MAAKERRQERRPESESLVPQESIEGRILVLRGKRIMLDRDLAEIYGVTTGRLNEQVKRNRGRFPEDFMFQLNKEEFDVLRSQIAIFKMGRGQHRKYLPFAFTEHGAVMLASILNSPVAVSASIQVVRAFVQLREMLSEHANLRRKIADMERKYDSQFRVVFDAIRQLLESPQKPKKRIRFLPIGRGLWPIPSRRVLFKVGHAFSYMIHDSKFDVGC